MTIFDQSRLPSKYRAPLNRRYPTASSKEAAKPAVTSGAANAPGAVPQPSSSFSSPSSSPVAAKSIADLPPELLAKIFAHGAFADVRSIRSVSRDFRGAASDPALLQQKLAQAGLPLPSGPDDAVAAWTHGLRHLHVQKNWDRGRYAYKKLSTADAAGLYPPPLTRKQQSEIQQFKTGVLRSFAHGLSHDGSLFAYAPLPSALEAVHLVDMTSPAKQERQFHCPELNPTHPAFSRDQQHLVVATYSREAVTWNLKDGTQTRVCCCNKHQHVSSLALSSDGGKLATLTGSYGWLSDVKGAPNLASALKRTLRGKDSTVRVFDLTVSPPAQILETWVNLGDSHINQLDFSPDDSRLLCKTLSGTRVRVWDFEAPGLHP